MTQEPGQPPSSPAALMALRGRQGETVALPRNLTVMETPELLRVTWHWKRVSTGTVVFGFVCIALATLMTMAASGGKGGAIALMLLPHTLWAMALRDGRVVVDVERGRVQRATVWGNLRWDRHSLAAGDIQQLYVVEEEKRVRGGTVRVVRLKARLSSGDVILADSMDSVEQGRAMEHILEKHLGIVDAPVR